MDNEIALSVIVGGAYEIEAPAQKVEFLAKRLLVGEAFGRKVLIGTPIYVSLADGDVDDKTTSDKRKWWQIR